MSDLNINGALGPRKAGSPIVLDPHLPEQGGVDRIRGGRLCGWYRSSGGGKDIVLTINGDQKWKCVADQPLKTRLGSKIHDQPIGFSFDVSDLPRRKINTLTLSHSKTSFDFDGLILRFCPLINRYRERLRGIFFPEFYKNRYELWGMSNREAFNHYCSVGIYLDWSPNPWFSSEFYRKHYPHKLKNVVIPILSYLEFEKDRKVRPSEDFDPAYYHERNPDLHGIRSMLEHYVSHGHHEGRYPTAREIPARVLEELRTLSRIEPALEGFDTRERRIERYPVLSRSTYLPRFVGETLGEGIDVVVCVPYLSCGGADMISLFALRAYQQRFGAERVLLIVTDRPANTVPNWMERDTRVIYLDHETSFGTFDDRVQTLHAMIGRLAPKIVLNVNSHATWELYLRHGRQLCGATNLLAYLFCFDYTPEHRLAGYIKDYLPRTLPFLKQVVFDNAQIITDATELFGFPPRGREKLHTVYVPLPKRVRPTTGDRAERERTGKVLWVGRLARQKRPELLLSIAEAMPSLQFVVYGPEGDSPMSAALTKPTLPNVEYRGVFGDVDEIDPSEFDFILNTSAWEGLPTILIQMMGLGIPIVTSCVGGIGELVSHDTGWLVEEGHLTDAYVSTIRKALIADRETVIRARRGVQLVRERHVWDTFYERLDSLGVFETDIDRSAWTQAPLDRRRYAA